MSLYILTFHSCILIVLLLFILMAIITVGVTLYSPTLAFGQTISGNGTQLWIDKLNNVKIQFSYLPEKPSMDDLLQLQFSIQNLQNGSHLKNLIAKVTVTNNPIYKFDNITIADGDLSIRCPFLDPGTH